MFGSIRSDGIQYAHVCHVRASGCGSALDEAMDEICSI